MRSIVQEAASIQRAIDQAWNNAGKPLQFTITILDEGERNFFGISKRPARVSIMYDLDKAEFNTLPKSEKSRKNRPANTSRKRMISTTGGSADWQPEWQSYISQTMKEIAELMKVETPFEVLHDKKLLTISFAKDLVADEDEQRMLFASLSYLLIQLLKRQYKNRFIGYKVMVTAAQSSVKKRPQGITKPTPRFYDPHETKRHEQSGYSDDIRSEQMQFAKQQLEREFEQETHHAETKNDKYELFYELPEDEVEDGPQDPHASLNAPNETSSELTDGDDTTDAK